MNDLDRALRAAGFVVRSEGRTAREDYRSPRSHADRSPRPQEFGPLDPARSVARSGRMFTAVLARPCPRHGAAPGESCWPLYPHRNFCAKRGGKS